MKFPYSSKPLVLAAAACLLPLTGMAAESSDNLNYRYVQLDYINMDIDQPHEDSLFRDDFDNGGGYGISLSIPISEALFVYASYSDTESDFNFVDNTGAWVPGSTDLLRLDLGLGVILPMSDVTDVVLSGGYADIDYDDFRLGASSSASLNDLKDDPSDGYVLEARLRSQLGRSVEGSIGARYTDIGNADGFSLVANLMYEFTPNWGLNLSVDAGDELVTWGAGVRYSF